jgi:hypothetical protein
MNTSDIRGMAHWLVYNGWLPPGQFGMAHFIPGERGVYNDVL